MKKAPDHYKGTLEPKDFIRCHALNFNRGCVIKYITRAGRKVLTGDTPHDALLRDLNKAKHYIEFEIDAVEKEYKRDDK